MAVNVSPFGPKPAFQLASGLPAVGGQLFFYVAGSVSTKQSTYTTSTGGAANTNPLVLNALGEPATEIWFTAGQGYKVVYAPVGDTDPPSSPIWSIDNLYGINDVTVSQTEWVAGPAPTYVSATQFTLVGDQTSTFQVGRRVKTTNTSGTIYSTITVSAFAAVTTVTVTNDSGVLDSGLSAVSYGLLTATNGSVPGVKLTPTSVSLMLAGSAVLTATGALMSTADNFTAGNALAIPAGGTAGQGLMYTSTANFGVFFGSGAPTLAAAKGSLYLRSDGSTTNDRAYINTNGATTWTALITVA